MIFAPPFRSILVLSFAAVVAASIGCAASPVCVHPLSDDSNSTIDHSLLGQWEVVEEDESPPGRITIRIDEKHPHRLELEMVDADSGTRKVPAYATRILDQRFLSFPFDPSDPKLGWAVVHYQSSEEAIAAHLMDAEAIVSSIDANKLKGIVERNAEPANEFEETPTPEITKVLITAEPAELRKYLLSNSAAVYHSGEPLLLRKLPPAE